MGARTLLLSLLILAAAPAVAHALPDAPDLTIELPATPYPGQQHPVFVDAFQEPGRLLYRFDSIIHNGGGTLDVYGDAAGVRQALWPGGQPTTPPDPMLPPPDGTPFSDRTGPARFEYVVEETHEHWHFFSAARYELDVPGEGKRVSGKIGFCLFDSFDTSGPVDSFPGSDDWCRFDDPDATFVRMGLSPGAADRYAAQREFQYVDMTGLAPGIYLLRGIANPNGELVESDTTNNVTGQLRELPGVRASALSATVEAGRAGPLTLAAEIVAPQVPARRNRTCSMGASSCYLEVGDQPPAFAVAEPPAHGTVTIAGATATYTPAPGFEGADRFTYTATDPRGLVSAPAAVDLRVERSSVAPPPPPSAAVTPKRLLRIGAARRTRSALLVPVRCRPAATGTCAGTVTARLAGRPLARRAFTGLAAGSTRTLRLRLTRADRRALAGAPRRRIVLTATVRDGRAAGVPARRVVAR